MRYEGVTILDGHQVALFAILPGAPTAGSGADRSDNSVGRELGKAAYRVDDGMLDRLVLGSTSIRRIAIEIGDARN